MNAAYVTGDRVPWTGRYWIMRACGGAMHTGREVTCEAGDRFPPAPPGCWFILNPEDDW